MLILNSILRERILQAVRACSLYVNTMISMVFTIVTKEERELHSTVVVLAFLTQKTWVQISLLPNYILVNFGAQRH